MNYTKINQEAIKTILVGGKYGFKVPGYWDNDYLIITFDGFCAYIIPSKSVVFDRSHVQTIEKKFPDLDKIAIPENEIHLTKTYVESGRCYGKTLLRVFKGSRDLDKKNKKEWKVYINSKMMKPLEREDSIIQYYQEYDEKIPMNTRPIFAYKAGENPVPLMVLLPVRVFDEDFD